MTNNTETWAIIQARMGSSRLPGKVLRPLADIPALVHVVERTRAIEGVSRVIVATSTAPLDDPIEALVSEWFDDIAVVRGPEDDVLARYVLALGDDPPPYFVRVTGDSPLMSFEHASAMLKTLIESGADGANAHHQHTGLTTGLGSEAYRTQALFDAHRHATSRSDREHVTTWIKRSPRHFVLYPEPVPTLASDLRLTLDYPQDYHVVSRVYVDLHRGGGDSVRACRELPSRAPRSGGHQRSLRAQHRGVTLEPRDRGAER